VKKITTRDSDQTLNVNIVFINKQNRISLQIIFKFNVEVEEFRYLYNIILSGLRRTQKHKK